jgi:hypothetical protein
LIQWYSSIIKTVSKSEIHNRWVPVLMDRVYHPFLRIVRMCSSITRFLIFRLFRELSNRRDGSNLGNTTVKENILILSHRCPNTLKYMSLRNRSRIFLAWRILCTKNTNPQQTVISILETTSADHVKPLSPTTSPTNNQKTESSFSWTTGSTTAPSTPNRTK